MSSTSSTTRGRLTDDRVAEVYDHVLRLLVANGYDNLTMDAVAQAASCSKATLYRQWGGKADLVVGALQCHDDRDDPALLDTGALASDLRAWADRVDDGDLDNGLLVAVVRACATDPELAASVRERILDQSRSGLLAVVDRAVERGEIAADHPAIPHLMTVVGAPFTLRQILEGRPVDAAYLRSYVDAVVLPALGVS